MNKFIMDNKFWMILVEFENLKKQTSLSKFLIKHELNEDEFYELISYLDSLNYRIKTVENNGEVFLQTPKEKIRINFNLSFVQWLSMQSHFPTLDLEKDSPFHEILVQKLSEVEQKYPQHDLFSKKYQNCSEFLNIIEETIANKSQLYFKIKNNKQSLIYPHQLVFIDGKLSLIGEECHDRCLVYFEVDLIERITNYTSKPYEPNFKNYEVNDFVMAIRSIEGKDVRLILKIKAIDENIDLNPKFHFLGNPFVTRNMDGDFIWAASVEASPELFNWLNSIIDYIEILDPESLKTEFLDYVKNKSKYKIAA